MCKHRDNRNAKGFTLIESLVVLATMAMSLSILMPPLQRAREQARRMVCATNLRDIGAAMSVYANNHDDRLPLNQYDF